MLIDQTHRLLRARYRLSGFRSAILPLGWCQMRYFHHHEGGTGRTLLLVHGLGTSSSSWMRVAPHLAKDHSVIIPDLPGYGASALTDGSPFADLKRLQDSLNALVTAQLPERFTIIGHSLGGLLAADLALTHQSRVEQLILINTTGIIYPGVERQRSLFAVDSVGATRELLDHLWLSFPWYFRPFIPSVFRELKRRHVTEFVGSITADHMLNHRIGSLRIPTDLVWGTDDRLIGRESIDILRTLLPQLRVRMIDRCGHIPQLERPRALLRILRGLLVRPT